MPLLTDSLLGFAVNDSLNAILNALTIVGLIAMMVAAVPFVRSRRKDGVILQLEQALKASDLLGSQMKTQLEGAQVRMDRLERERNAAKEDSAACKAKYEALEQYTARPALEAVITTLTRIENTIRVQGDAANELMMKNLEVLARIAPPQ